MKCVTPMFRIYDVGNYKKGHVISREEALKVLQQDNNYYRAIKKYNRLNSYHQMEMIPCQHCWACLINKSAEKATEIMAEVKESKNPSWFITLTYDQAHLPIAEELVYKEKYKYYKDGVEYYDFEYKTYENDGTWISGTLAPIDLKKFIKRMRNEFERKGIHEIKYYACGEYGTETQRPHYHIILINVPLDISQFYRTHIDENFKAHWKSKQVERWWSEDKKKGQKSIPIGMIDVAECEWSTAAYVARYTAKKIFNQKSKEAYYQAGKLPEFTRSSKNIGKEYYEKNKKEIYKTDEMIGKTIGGRVGRYKPPKKYDNWFKEEFPEEWEKIKKSRMTSAQRAEKLRQEITDYTDLELQNIETEKVLLKNNMLPREGDW